MPTESAIEDACALDKARAALAAAKDIEPAQREYLYLLEIARIQAEIAQAEALTRIATQLEAWSVSVGDFDAEAIDVHVRSLR